VVLSDNVGVVRSVRLKAQDVKEFSVSSAAGVGLAWEFVLVEVYLVPYHQLWSSSKLYVTGELQNRLLPTSTGNSNGELNGEDGPLHGQSVRDWLSSWRIGGN
jgi:hypothetical protein